ncbi:MAG: hypothetical protein HXX17_16725 [Geobacteraceae bacterium]|nr:hypothetical protein [Geobacteraceae bacterium]
MKKLYAVITALAISLSVGVTAMAQSKNASKKAGCSSCQKSEATPEQMKKFKVESLDLRQEMMNKRFELQRENLKDTPDAAKGAALKADMDAIKVKIEAIKTANKIPASVSCGKGDCMLMDGGCDKCDSKKGCDKSAKASKHCDKCNKKADCGCKECGKKGDCKNCADAANCNCSKKKK